MPLRVKGMVWTIVFIFTISSLSGVVSPHLGHSEGECQIGLSQAACQTFESLHAAEMSGAKIDVLVDSYNALLQKRPQPFDSNYSSIGSLAVQAQQLAIANRNFSNTSLIILVPVIALVFTIVSVGLISIARRLSRDKFLDMRIRGN